MRLLFFTIEISIIFSWRRPVQQPILYHRCLFHFPFENLSPLAIARVNNMPTFYEVSRWMVCKTQKSRKYTPWNQLVFFKKKKSMALTSLLKVGLCWTFRLFGQQRMWHCETNNWMGVLLFIWQKDHCHFWHHRGLFFPELLLHSTHYGKRSKGWTFLSIGSSLILI